MEKDSKKEYGAFWKDVFGRALMRKEIFENIVKKLDVFNIIEA
jgi:hypothetical protein